jgi:hypothetical protein
MLRSHAVPGLLILACAAFFYRAGEVDGYSGVLWGGLSILISLAVYLGLNGGLFGIVLGQLGLFAAITLYRVRREP